MGEAVFSWFLRLAVLQRYKLFRTHCRVFLYFLALDLGKCLNLTNFLTLGFPPLSHRETLCSSMKSPILVHFPALCSLGSQLFVVLVRMNTNSTPFRENVRRNDKTLWTFFASFSAFERIDSER